MLDVHDSDVARGVSCATHGENHAYIELYELAKSAHVADKVYQPLCFSSDGIDRVLV